MDEHVAPQSHADSGHRDQFSRDRALLQDTALKCCGREIAAGDLNDGLPRGFLAGAIVKMWVRIASIRPVNFLGGEAKYRPNL